MKEIYLDFNTPVHVHIFLQFYYCYFMLIEYPMLFFYLFVIRQTQVLIFCWYILMFEPARGITGTRFCTATAGLCICTILGNVD